MTGDGKDRTEMTSENSQEEEDLEEHQEMRESSSTSDGQDSNTEEEIGVPAVEFQHPLLKGKSPEEIERIFETQESALKDVTKEANELHSRLNVQATAPTPQVEEEEEDYGDDFLAPKMRLLEGRLKKSMEEMVRPLKDNLSAGRAQSAREMLRGRHQLFSTLEPHIDRLLREQGIDPATAGEQQLTLLYHTALGVATEQGIDLRGTTEAPRNERPPMSIPQHRPSSAPLPKTPEKQKRELTENERILAKHYRMSEDEYRAFQDQTEDDVVEPGYSKEGW